MFCYTYTHPVYKTTCTIDSGKKTLASAFSDICEYCKRMNYPLPNSLDQIRHAA